jgi:hypothetical protein
MGGRDRLELRGLRDLAPWEWPEGTDASLLAALRDEQAAPSDRLLAAELAGDCVVVNEDLVAALLAILRDGAAAETLRGLAAISLGPVLELADTDGFDDPDDVPISERTFEGIQKALRKLFSDADVPTGVRRRILEASVRAPRDWHRGAVRTAHRSDDAAWKLTAAFCMRYVRGLDEEILEALESEDTETQSEAVGAAGAWGVQAAWPRIAALIDDEGTSRRVLLEAIEAVACIRPMEAADVLADLADSDDEEIAVAVSDALAMAEARGGDEDDED